MKTRLFKYILKILQPKKENFQTKKSDIFQISAQNIYCRYLLEPPRRDEIAGTVRTASSRRF